MRRRSAFDTARRRRTGRRQRLGRPVRLYRDSLDAALRFLTAANETFEELARMPGMGTLKRFRKRQLAGIRQWRIQGFQSYLIFYREIEDGIEVIRVLHGARDIESILEGTLE